MKYLVGDYERSIDGNGRLTLPSLMAALFDGEAYLADDPEECVRIYLPDQFDTVMTETIEKFHRGEIDRAAVRAVSGPSRQIKIDKQGRLTLDDRARKNAEIELGSDVILIGTLDSLEVWQQAKGEMRREELSNHHVGGSAKQAASQ